MAFNDVTVISFGVQIKQSFTLTLNAPATFFRPDACRVSCNFSAVMSVMYSSVVVRWFVVVELLRWGCYEFESVSVDKR